MEFRIFGPLEIVSEGNTVRPRGVEARLLAVLLLDAGRSVSLARLIDGIWDGDAPATASRQVANTVSQLRKKFGERWIARSGDGYVLDLSGCTVDALRFGELVQRARATRKTAPGAALALLREALALWRGTALSDLAGRIIDAAARSFEESRLAAVELRFDLELELGESTDVANEARRTLDEYPYRQKVAGQLMLALYRQQRTPEALEVFEQLRTRLADDLGLDPGERLRDLHTAILRDDPSLGGAEPVTETTRPANPVPAQLPVPPLGFTGREEQLATLDESRDGPTRCCVVAGAAGVGKSALAVHWAHRVREEFPDGQLFVNLRGFDHGEPVAPVEALGRFIRALRGPETAIPSDVDEATGVYRTALNGRRVLVVLDNARDAAQVRPLLPGPESFAVVTSRNRLTGLTALNAAVPVQLTPLPSGESALLLKSIVDKDRLRADPDAAHRLARLCGHLPLALRIAAAQLNCRPDGDIAALIEELDGPRRLEALSVDGDPDATVATTVDLSWQTLDPDAQRLLLTLGLTPGEDYSRELVTALSGLPEDHTQRVLNTLEAVHLLEQHHLGRYRFHDLTRLYAARRAEQDFDPAARRAVQDRFIEWHHQVKFTVRPNEHKNVLFAITSMPDHPKLWQLISPIAVETLNEGVTLERARQLIDIGATSADRHHDAYGRFRMTSLRSSYHWASGDYDTAVELAGTTVTLADDLDDEAQLIANQNLGVVLSRFSYAKAEPALRKALEVAERTPDWAGLPTLMLNLGDLYRKTCDFAEARRLLSRIPEPVAGSTFSNVQLTTMGALAWLDFESGRHDDARVRAERCADMAVHIGHLRCESFSRSLLAELHLLDGDHGAAVAQMLRALDLAGDTERSQLYSETLCKLINMYYVVGDRDSVIERAHQLSQSATEQWGTAVQADIQVALCQQSICAERFSEAIPHGRIAVDITEALPRPLHHARALTAVADAHTGLGEHGTARKLREQALGIFTELGVPDAAPLRELLAPDPDATTR